MESTLRRPEELMVQANPDAFTASEPELRLSFSVLRVSRDDPAEAALIAMLTASEPRPIKDEPIVGSRYERYQNDPEAFGITRAKYVIEKLPGKSVVHGAVVDGDAVAVTDAAMQKARKRKATVSGRQIQFRRSKDGAIRAFEADSGDEIPVTRAYWFAWISFYPGTQLVE